MSKDCSLHAGFTINRQVMGIYTVDCACGNWRGFAQSIDACETLHQAHVKGGVSEDG